MWGFTTVLVVKDSSDPSTRKKKSDVPVLVRMNVLGRLSILLNNLDVVPPVLQPAVREIRLERTSVRGVARVAGQTLIPAHSLVTLRITGVQLMMMSWCLMSSDVIWHIRDKLWPMPKHGSIRKVYACLAVTCHLHFWQNDRDFLRATVVTRGWNGYRNKSQHRKSTLEKKILPPFQQGFEPATFQSRVRRSNHWAIPPPWECSGHQNPFGLTLGPTTPPRATSHSDPCEWRCDTEVCTPR